MLNAYTLSHVIRDKVFGFGKVRTKDAIKDKHTAYSLRDEQKAKRAVQ